MSLASSPDFLFRPEDQTYRMLFSNAVDDANSFEEFFNEDMYKLDSSSEESSEQPNEFDNLFQVDTSLDEQYRLPSLSDSPKFEQSPVQPWRQGVWCLKQNQTHSPIVAEMSRKPESKRPASMQTMNLISHGFRGSQSPIEAVRMNQTKPVATSPDSTTFKPAMYAHPAPSREATLSPSPMYSQLPISSRYDDHGDIGTWQQDFENFHLQKSQSSNQRQQVVSTVRESRYGTSAQKLNHTIITRNHGVGVTSPSFDQGYAEMKYHVDLDPVLLGSTRESQDDYLQHHSLDSLMPQSLNSSNLCNSMQSPPGESLTSASSNHSRGTTVQSSSTNMSVHSQAFLSPTTTVASHPPLPTLAPEEMYPVLAAPKPQRLPHQLLYHDHTETTRTATQYPTSKQQINRTGLYEPHPYHHMPSNGVGVAIPYPAPRQQPRPKISAAPGAAGASMSSYPALPPLPSTSTYVFPDGSPFTPRKQRHSPSRSPSPSISPTNLVISPRRNRHRSPTRTVTEYAHTRRKSIHKPGPMKGTVSNATSSSSHQGPPPPTPRARARSHSRPPRTPKTPRTPTSSYGAGGGGGGGGMGTMMVDFVNFTPKDSAKLLSDVAPSGSSKTRARRELEAREKRKKLSEAALKAVQVAGGDVSVFERAIIMA